MSPAKGAKFRAPRAATGRLDLSTLRLNLYLPTKLHARALQLATDQGIRLSHFVRIALVEHIERIVIARGQAYVNTIGGVTK